MAATTAGDDRTNAVAPAPALVKAPAPEPLGRELARRGAAVPPGPTPAAPAAPRALRPAEVGPASVLADPDLADPRIAAARYRGLLADVEARRDALNERTREGRAGVVAGTQRYRDAAAAIRAKVEETWTGVGPPLAQHGLIDLDQLRPEPAAEQAVAAGLPEGKGRGDRRGQGRGEKGRPLARRSGRHSDQAAPGRAGGRAPAGIDPNQAKQEAHQHCIEARAAAGELRGLSRGGASTSVTLVAGAVCLLVGALTALARLAFDASAPPCLAAGALAGWLAVTSLSGGSRLVAVRAGLVAAGTAGVAVLSTLRLAPSDPVGVAASLAVVALAIRFGFGIGGGDAKTKANAAAGGKSRGGRGR
jgi:hypothetical protein